MLVYKEPTEEAPCKHACPAGVDVPRYVRLTADGKFTEALAVIREKIPFPSVCGRICFQPCEAKCRVCEVDRPIAIRALKRFAVERGAESPIQELPVAKSTGKRVAIVGSGPAGLTGAYYLAKLGHAVTVFEEASELGGMMNLVISRYRLPKDVLDTDIKVIVSVGIDVRTNTRVDSVDKLFKQGYDAVLMAIGAHKPMKMGIEGEDGPGVIECLTFLRDVNQDKKVSLGEKVAVVGGGNSAVDAARVALRLGVKEVTVVYRRSQAEMPANPAEVDEALLEGVRFLFLTAPSKITRDKGIKLECIRTKLGEPDESGRPRPEPIPGSEFSLDVDTVVTAVAQTPDIPAKLKLATDKGNTLQVTPDTLATSRAGVFAAGDVVTGPASVIEAIAAGRKAAVSVDKYLGGNGVIDEVLTPPETTVTMLDPGLPIGERVTIPSLPVEERLVGFSQVELSLTEEAAVNEAKRCLRCDLPILVDIDKCNGCQICQLRCSLRFEDVFNPAKAAIKIDKFAKGGLEYGLSFTDKCDACGICSRYCPYGTLTRQKVKEGGLT